MYRRESVFFSSNFNRIIYRGDVASLGARTPRPEGRAKKKKKNRNNGGKKSETRAEVYGRALKYSGRTTRQACLHKLYQRVKVCRGGGLSTCIYIYKYRNGASRFLRRSRPRHNFSDGGLEKKKYI